MTITQLTHLAQATEPPLADATQFWWGALGAVLALLVVQVLPFLFEALHKNAAPDIALWKVGIAAGILVIFVLGGGVAALIPGDASKKGEALAYGLAWQASLGGAIQGVRAGLK